MHPCTYRKVASSRMSRLVAHSRIFRLFVKGKNDAYVLWPLAKRVQNRIVNRSTTRDFTVLLTLLLALHCCRSRLSPLAWNDFRVKVFRIRHTIVHFMIFISGRNCFQKSNCWENSPSSFRGPRSRFLKIHRHQTRKKL